MCPFVNPQSGLTDHRTALIPCAKTSPMNDIDIDCVLVSHVGTCVGDGMIVHAYRSGAPVSLDPYDPWGAYNFVRRIVG